MPHESRERATRYRERSHALRSLAAQAESKTVKAALQGVATDYELMACKLETNGLPNGQSGPFSRAGDQTPRAR
jgi:hypothetical protein